MFKNMKKKTGIIFGAAAVSAMAFFPIAVAVKPNPTTAPLNSASVMMAADVPSGFEFTTSDGTIVKTPDKVITTDGLSSANFNDAGNVKEILRTVPTALEAFMKGSKSIYAKDSAGVLSVAGTALIDGGAIDSSAPEYASFVALDNQKKLYKDLNPELGVQKTTGYRFDYSVPSQVAPIDHLKSGAVDAKSAAAGFTYKIATVDPTAIAADQTLTLDYMYSATSSTMEKVQIVFPYSDALQDDTISVSTLLSDENIFLRSQDDTFKTKVAGIPNSLSLSDLGLTMVRDDSGISLYSTLGNVDSTSSIKIDGISNPKQATAASIGILEEDTQPGKIQIKPKDGDPKNKVTDFKEFSSQRDWTPKSGYQWQNGDSGETTQIDFYMKAGSSLDGVSLLYAYPGGTLKDAITITAGDSKMTMTPADALSIAPEHYGDGDKSFEINWQKAGDWYKATITVPKGQTNGFFVGDTDQTDERPWLMDAKQRQGRIFFENPTTNSFAGTGSILTRKLEKKIDNNTVTREAYRYVYGSWIPNTKIVPTPIATILNNEGQVGNKEPWKDIMYHLPKTDAINFDDSDSEIKKIPTGDTMTQIIEALNDYHNALIDIEVKKLPNFAPEENNGKDSYLPDTDTKFDNLLSDYISKAAGDDLTDKINAELKDAEDITKLTYDEYMKVLNLWKNDNAAYLAKYKTETPLFDFVAVKKRLGDAEFKRLIDTVLPTNKDKDTDNTKTGDITVARYIQKDVEEIIPKLFENEWAAFKTNMAGIKGARFAAFLDDNLGQKTNILDSHSIINGKSKVSGIPFVDVSATPKTVEAKTGKALVKELLELVYKTGFYKSIFAGQPALEAKFLAIYDDKTPDSDLWDGEAYRSGKQIGDMLDVVKTIFDSMRPADSKYTFDTAMGQEKDFEPAFESLATGSAKQLASSDKSIDFKWTVGNEYKGTYLQKQVILTNIDNVVEYLKTHSKTTGLGEKLDKFISTFVATESSDTAIAQLGPTLGRYKIQDFIPAFSTDPVQTEAIVEQMVHVDPIRVLIPNTGQSKTFEVLENKGGAATLGLVVAAGVLIFLIGGVLMGLSFTKRLVVGGHTWSWKMIVIRAALLVIALAGIYMVLTGTVLPGHTALTTIVNV